MSLSIDPMPHLPARRVSRTPDCDIPYALHDFLDDQHRLLSPAKPHLPFSGHTIETLDGRMLVIHLASLLEAARAREHATRVFVQKYGPAAGASRFSRFCLVLDFLGNSHAEISNSGLAENREPIAIREEFVRYLLDWKVGPKQRRLPKSALSRFLDDWGHRWM